MMKVDVTAIYLMIFEMNFFSFVGGIFTKESSFSKPKTILRFIWNMSDQDHGRVGADVPDNAQDLTIFVQNLLEQMVNI